MAMQWIPAHEIYPGRWVDPTDFSMPYIGDGVEFEPLMESSCPHCGGSVYETEGWNCPECGEPLMW
jgi:hypothetical protein